MTVKTGVSTPVTTPWSYALIVSELWLHVELQNTKAKLLHSAGFAVLSLLNDTINASMAEPLH